MAASRKRSSIYDTKLVATLLLVRGQGDARCLFAVREAVAQFNVTFFSSHKFRTPAPTQSFSPILSTIYIISLKHLVCV